MHGKYCPGSDRLYEFVKSQIEPFLLPSIQRQHGSFRHDPIFSNLLQFPMIVGIHIIVPGLAFPAPSPVIQVSGVKEGMAAAFRQKSHPLICGMKGRDTGTAALFQG